MGLTWRKPMKRIAMELLRVARDLVADEALWEFSSDVARSLRRGEFNWELDDEAGDEATIRGISRHSDTVVSVWMSKRGSGIEVEVEAMEMGDAGAESEKPLGKKVFRDTGATQAAAWIGRLVRDL